MGEHHSRLHRLEGSSCQSFRRLTLRAIDLEDKETADLFSGNTFNLILIKSCTILISVEPIY